MLNKEKIKKFLTDSNEQLLTYIDPEYSYNSHYYYKESCDERFALLYEKNYKENKMDSSRYDFAGYYDCIDNIIYNPSYDIKNMVEKNNICKVSSLEILINKIDKGIKSYLKNFALNNGSKLKKQFSKEFNEQNEYTFSNYEKETEREFIENINLEEIDLSGYNPYYHFESYDDFRNKSIYKKYLDNPTEEIEKISKDFLKDENFSVKKDLAFILLEKDWKDNYLSLIKENKDHKYDWLYINRDLLSSIRDIEAQNINITIKYDEEILTFKYPKSSLECDLKSGDTDSSGWNKSYDVVKEFLKKHKDAKDWHNSDFDFKNIVSITYGKKILFEKDDDKELEKNIEDNYDVDITDEMY